MDHLVLLLGDGTQIAVPPSLNAITTYVLLEQEAWFEKEAGFVPHLLSAGQTVIDIGANLGVYSLPMARRVGEKGRVIAYEPASATRALLEISLTRNRFDNLEIVAAALSDSPREARLGFGWSSELHTLNSAEGAGESVRVTTLDDEDATRKWPSVDFLKIDAEGEEIHILEGARKFFARHSPIVMFEFRSGITADSSIAAAFRTIGYGVFRVLNGAPLLVPVAEGEELDAYELNLFAVNPERAALLEREGLLVREMPPDWSADEAARDDALALLKAQAYAASFPNCFSNAGVDPLYRSALAGYAAWRNTRLPAQERYAALLFAYRKMLDLCQMSVTPARLSTMARIAFEAGRATTASKALDGARQFMQRGDVKPNEPFWPASPRFDAIAAGANPDVWFAVSALEQLERISAYSSLFGGASPDLDWLSRQPFASTEMERRRLLKRLRIGERLAVPERLKQRGPDHINAEVWRAGLVPNTLGARD